MSVSSNQHPHFAAVSTGHLGAESTYVDARYVAMQPEYEAMLKLSPNSAEAQNGAGMAERDLGNIGAAEQRFRAALAINPNFADAQRNLARLR